jgi:predicted DNA-binding transcriptional regulator AlpA
MTDQPILSAEETAQSRFNKTYISSAEIMQELNVSRQVIQYARKTGKLPGAIVIQENSVYIWERSEIEDYLHAWKIILNARRG